MRLTRLPAALVTALLLAGAASCATTVEGSGTPAADLVTSGPLPSGGTDDPTGSPDPGDSSPPTPTASPTVNSVQVRQRALCVLERATIAGTNTRFNDSKQRSQQIQILKQGAATIAGQLSRSGLPGDDAVLRAGKAVQTQLAALYTAANGGKTPSTKPYNDATSKFQKACNSIP
jgi:hypothetical protein